MIHYPPPKKNRNSVLYLKSYSWTFGLSWSVVDTHSTTPGKVTNFFLFWWVSFVSNSRLVVVLCQLPNVSTVVYTFLNNKNDFPWPSSYQNLPSKGGEQLPHLWRNMDGLLLVSVQEFSSCIRTRCLDFPVLLLILKPLLFLCPVF